jgi:aspartate kinase
LAAAGSDTTAVALAAALKADRCQILKDVDGVFTTNPRVVPEARKLDEISYDEMLELASLGAEVCSRGRWSLPRSMGWCWRWCRVSTKNRERWYGKR